MLTRRPAAISIPPMQRNALSMLPVASISQPEMIKMIIKMLSQLAGFVYAAHANIHVIIVLYTSFTMTTISMINQN